MLYIYWEFRDAIPYLEISLVAVAEIQPLASTASRPANSLDCEKDMVTASRKAVWYHPVIDIQSYSPT